MRRLKTWMRYKVLQERFCGLGLIDIERMLILARYQFAKPNEEISSIGDILIKNEYLYLRYLNFY